MLDYRSKEFIRTIGRLRSENCICPTFLHKMKLSGHPYCACKELGTIKHLRMEFLLYERNRMKIFDKIIKLLTLPFNLETILSYNILKLCKELYYFVKL